MVTSLAAQLTDLSWAPSTVRRPWNEVRPMALAAAALWSWPDSGATRLARLFPRPVGGAVLYTPLRILVRVLHGPRRLVAVSALAGLVGVSVAGIGGAIALALVAGLAAHRWRNAATAGRQGAQRAALLDAIGLMATELRAGAHPAAAAVTAAEAIATVDSGGAPRKLGLFRPAVARGGGSAAHRVLMSVAAGARLGAEVPALFERHAHAEPAIADELRRVAAAWTLAERHGVALAELMDAVRADLDASARLSGQIKAQLAGPRSTAGVLAGLPLVGVLLGQAMGADPWTVLTGTPLGQVLLVVGVGLGCAGVAWSGRITARAVPR